MLRCHVWVGVVLLGSALAADPARAETVPERIEAVKKLLTESKFPDATKAIEAALAEPGNDEATVLALYELSGVAAAQQKKEAPKARVAFQRVLSLDPAHKLTGKWPPKVTQAFAEAKKAFARLGAAGPLAVEQLTPEIKGSQVVAVYFSIENDVLKLGKKARVHLRLDSGAWTTQDVPMGPTMKADLAAKTVEWWVELVGERGETLAHLASQDAPVVDLAPGAPPPKKGPAPAATATGKPPVKDTGTAKPPGKDTPAPKTDGAKTGAPVADKKAALTPAPKDPPPELVVKAGPKSKVRILPWALVGAGVAAGAVGVGFGVKAQGERAKIGAAVTNPNGVVIGMTRAQALSLDSQARTDSAVANSLMVGGLLVAVAGGVVWYLGREETP